MEKHSVQNNPTQMNKMSIVNMENVIRKDGLPPPYEMSPSETQFYENLYFKAKHAMKYASLATLTLQNASLNLMMRYARMQKDLFISSTAVVMAEILKLLICLFMVGLEEGNFWLFLGVLKKDILKQPMETFKVAIPSFVYLLQNNLLYVGATHLDAATCQVTYQLKILTTALLSVLMLKKKLSMQQWFSLVTLFVGVAVVQLAQLNAPASSETIHEQKPLLGMTAIVVACCLSGFAGVYFEKILKSSDDITVWMRNIQLCIASIPLGFGTIYFMDGNEVSSKGFFHAYNSIVWVVVLLQAGGGIVVALVVKYADNILKGFATSLAIILSCITSMYFLNFHLTGQFVVGAALVMGSVYLYGRPQSAPAYKK